MLNRYFKNTEINKIRYCFWRK